jgi:hypothetical protein
VPRTASETLAEPAGETLQVSALPLRPGDVDFHLYLEGAKSGLVPLRAVSISAVSATGRHADVSFYVAGVGHDIAVASLARGVWQVHVAGRDGAGHRLDGSFAIPIN